MDRETINDIFEKKREATFVLKNRYSYTGTITYISSANKDGDFLVYLNDHGKKGRMVKFYNTQVSSIEEEVYTFPKTNYSSGGLYNDSFSPQDFPTTPNSYKNGGVKK